MKGNISRWIILLLALVCVVQVVSASFDIESETVNPASGDLEPGEQVTARYVLTYDVITTSDSSDELLEFSTGLSNPSWSFIVYRDSVAIYTTKKTGYYPSLTEFEIYYGDGDMQLEAQVSGTVPTSASGTVLVTKIEHVYDDAVKDTYSNVRNVVSTTQIESSISAQKENLATLQADIDEKAALGVAVSAAQAKYETASQALTNAASASPSQASSYITAAAPAIDEAEALLDTAWAEKEVSDTAATIEELDGMITYFVENRSMSSDAQVVAIRTLRESAVQYYTQAKDALNASNYSLARSKAADAQSKATEALTDANTLKEKIGEGFSLGSIGGGNTLLYIGVGIVLVLIVVGVVFYRRKTGWDELG